MKKNIPTTPQRPRVPMLMRALFLLILLAAAFLRFHDLDKSAVRGDELNFLNHALRNPSVVELWKNPPWLNQIPLAETIDVLWNRLRPGPPSEQTIREPFALLGWLTVAACMGWTLRRFSLYAALLVGCWLALLPFHIFQSREAYYYTPGIAFAAVFSFVTADLATRLAAGLPLRLRQALLWLGCAYLTCLCHMSLWMLAAVCWLVLLMAGWTGLPPATRKAHIAWLLGLAAALLVLMYRWIENAIAETLKTKGNMGVTSDTGHIGGAFNWVLPRIAPLFAAGFNGPTFILLALIAACAVIVFRKRRTLDPAASSLLTWLSWLLGLGFAVTLSYVLLIGRGSAKISYFAGLLPLFLIWSAVLLARAMDALPPRWTTPARAAFLAALVALLAQPAWQVTQLTGKPVPYNDLRQRLDALLPPGSVAIVDRWFEPWNEMVRYAPTNVTVTFTVPDEPFNNYTGLRWREVTQARIETGGVDAFIRLARNHEERVGLWTWPETWYAQHAVVSNTAAFWLRDHGYAPEQDYQKLNGNRMRVDIFYNTRADAVRRAIAHGVAFPAFFGADMPYEKSGPMGIFQLQTQQFLDWRVLGKEGTLEIHNPQPDARAVFLEIAAVSPAGAKSVRCEGESLFRFPARQMLTWKAGPLTLQPGANVIRLADAQPANPPLPLLISDVRVSAAPTPQEPVTTPAAAVPPQ